MMGNPYFIEKKLKNDVILCYKNGKKWEGIKKILNFFSSQYDFVFFTLMG